MSSTRLTGRAAKKLAEFSGQKFPVLQLNSAGEARMSEEAGRITLASAANVEGAMTLNNQMQLSPEELIAVVARAWELQTGQTSQGPSAAG